MDCTRKFLDSKARVVRGQIYKNLFASGGLTVTFTLEYRFCQLQEKKIFPTISSGNRPTLTGVVL